MRNLEDWLIHIESFHPGDIELGLERVQRVAGKLNLLDKDCPIVLVGGTNGKGSCVATFESLAQQAGLSIGTYTSPHLVSFNERIRLNGINVGDSDLVHAFERLEAERGDVPLTFFEFTTLAALMVFQSLQLDLIVLEVGLGGRLDAVNITQPDISIITTIANDHSDWLGDTLQDIAREKSGIARAGKPLLCGDKRSHELLLEVVTDSRVAPKLVSSASDKENQVINDPLINPLQLKSQNILLAKQAMLLLFPETTFELESCLKGIQLRGRLQHLSYSMGDKELLCILDVAHNQQAAQNLSRQIAGIKQRDSVTRVFAVCGMMADKSIQEVFKEMDAVIDEWVFVDLDIKRAASAQSLWEVYQHSNGPKKHTKATDVEAALAQISPRVSDKHRVLVFGSFITVAKMLD